MIDKSNEERVEDALVYLSIFKEEMTTDKKYYTEVLIKEVWRLRKIEQEHGILTIDDWEHKPLGDADAYPLPYVTVEHGGCEYVGRLRLYKNEDGEVIE